MRQQATSSRIRRRLARNQQLDKQKGVRGSQYTSLAFGKRCLEVGVRPSMGSVGDAYDNAMCESFFATLECELIDRQRFRSKDEARLAIFAFIEGFYNPRRRHSSIGQISPIEYERRHKQQPIPALSSLPSGSRPSRRGLEPPSSDETLAQPPADLDRRSPNGPIVL